MKQFPLYNYKSINKLSNFLNFQDKKSFLFFLKSVKFNSKKYYKIYTLKSKKNRKVFECNSEMKRIHTNLKNCFLKLNTPEYLFSGVKKKSYIDNAKFHKNSKNFYIIDIKKFYPSVTKYKIYTTLISSFKQSHNVADALSDILTVESEGKRFLVTGSPLSQIVAYFINKPMFDKINKLSMAYDIKFSLYVDDLSFSSKKNIPSKFKNELKKIIQYYDYSFSPDKTQSISIHDKSINYPKITGVSVQNNSNLLLPPDREETLLSLVSEFTQLTSLNINDFFDKLDTLNGLTIEALQINPDKYTSEREKINRFVKSFLDSNIKGTRRHIINNFGILDSTIYPRQIIKFSKTYITAITNTSRLLNIISNENFTKEIYKLVNDKFQAFIKKNNEKIQTIKNLNIQHQLVRKIISDCDRGLIYS